MSVLCSHCGEELMGAVNRCWRCGRLIASHSGPQDIPPIRRAPLTVPLHPHEIRPLEAVVLPDGMGPNGAPATRRGSPFDPQSTRQKVAEPPAYSGPTRHPLDRPEWRGQILTSKSDSSASGSPFAAAVAVGVGVLAIAISFTFPIATVCLSLVAIGLGVWGLFGRLRRVALFALVLACAALAWGALGVAIQIYELIYHVHPFAT